MKKILYTITLTLATILTGTSCSDFLSAYSQTMIVAKTVYDLDEVLLGGVYIKSKAMSEGPTIHRTAGFLNILDDDVNTGSIGDETSKTWGTCLSSIYGIYAWQLRIGSNFDASYFRNDNATWNDLYNRINVINILLDEITQLPHETDDELSAYIRIHGEAYFLRAQFYFMLANLYGDAYTPATCNTKLCVPLKLTPYVEHDKNKDTQFHRATLKEVYAQIIADLLQAKECLTRSPQADHHRLHRASMESVGLLLSRVYLYMQEWEKAEKEADEVMRSTAATLSSIQAFTSDKAFLTEDNPEILFSQGHNSLVTDLVFMARPGDFCVTKELNDMYDENDCRRDCFFGKLLATGDSIIMKNKYEKGSMVSHISDVFTLRMAEAYLNKAEACAIQGKAEEANQTLNALRKQRIEGYTPQSYTGEELVTQIRDERRKELCFEGHRWFDLRRYAVCESYPYSKEIIHVYHVCGNKGVSHTQIFRLEKNDKAYTFALPESVIQFDNVPMEDNPRDSREPLKADTEEETETPEQ